MRKRQIDGIRFVLFLMVFATHYASDPLDVGYLGYALPVFFVMSGFLITNVLLSTDHPRLLKRLEVFYVRRILRICPAYYLVVLLLVTMGLVNYPLAYLGYVLNIKLFVASLGPFAEFQQWFMEAWRRQSLHLWSLSVEEQFYIVYPLLLYLTSVRWRTAMLVTVLFMSIAARVWLMARYSRSFYGTLLPVCAEYFVWGCLFSWLESRRRLTWLSPSWALGVGLFFAVLLVAIEFHFGQSGFLQFSVSNYQTPIAAAMGFFIWGLWSVDETHIVARALSFRPFVYFGEMSYTLYLVHLIAWDLFSATGIVLPFSPETNGLIGGFVLSLLMGMAIWHGFEKPIYGLRRYLPYIGTQGSKTGV